MRLIDADAIELKYEFGMVNDEGIVCIPMRDVKKSIDNTPAINQWISVEERLPENDYGKHWKDRKYYLVKLAPSGLMCVAKFGVHQHDWWVDSHSSVLCKEYHTEVTHWMPLPEPPKE